jgi:hypothetical protein
MEYMGRHPAEQQLEFLRVLVEENAAIDGHVLQVSDRLWAIHGVIAVDGRVLMAEFDSYDDARRALDVISGEVGPFGS